MNLVGEFSFSWRYRLLEDRAVSGRMAESNRLKSRRTCQRIEVARSAHDRHFGCLLRSRRKLVCRL